MQKTSAPGGFFRALRHINYRRYYQAQAISLIGTQVQTTALSWLVWRLTHSSTKLAIIGFASQIPNLFLAPMGGVMADRYPRVRVVIITQIILMVQALALAACVLLGQYEYALLVLFALALGMVNSFDMPARQSLVVELAGRDDLPNAIALNAMLFNGTRAIGPAIAGVFLSYFSEGWFFLANGLSYIVVIWLLVIMKLPRRKILPRTGNMAQNLGEALKFVGTHVALRDALLNLSVLSIFGISYMVVLPAVAEHALGYSDNAKGYSLLLASSGVGAVIGAFLSASGKINAKNALTIPTAGVAFSLVLFFFSFSGMMWLSMLLMVAAGITWMVQLVSTNTFIQSLVPDELRGRVMSFYSTMLLGFLPMGMMLMGVLADHIGPLRSVRIGACVILAGALLLLSRRRDIETSISELVRLEGEEAAAVAALTESVAPVQVNG